MMRQGVRLLPLVFLILGLAGCQNAPAPAPASDDAVTVGNWTVRTGAAVRVDAVYSK
ncbi:hypothetical protein J2R99_001207 [Rhodopseudomonas julia]|uniref:Uncharacterized protein n=1 Tax=Rhodopseudomonas julia TaxID=200617 RepID=A0ABU0C5B3_9BRAD|nr:hypothetical protein [Rhodopseudomonas julia]MDQ0325358.1 hypothetical protein [Rhodopseudomonas julia]